MSVVNSKKNHCCKSECVDGTNNKERTRTPLTQALKRYHCEYLVDIILDYLHYSACLEVVQFQNDKASKHDNTNYQSFVHSTITALYPALPCSIWMKSRARCAPKSVWCSEVGKWVDEYQQGIEMRCVVFGSWEVGKTSLIGKFTRKEVVAFACSGASHYTKQVILNGEAVTFSVLDPGPKEMMEHSENRCIAVSTFFLLCFAVDCPWTYEEVLWKRERILEVKDDNDYGMMLVATKCDLWYDEGCQEKELVKRQMVIDQAKEWNIAYIETSVKLNKNVSFVFEQAFYEWWIQSQSQAQIHS